MKIAPAYMSVVIIIKLFFSPDSSKLFVFVSSSSQLLLYFYWSFLSSSPYLKSSRFDDYFCSYSCLSISLRSWPSTTKVKCSLSAIMSLKDCARPILSKVNPMSMSTLMFKLNKASSSFASRTTLSPILITIGLNMSSYVCSNYSWLIFISFLFFFAFFVRMVVLWPELLVLFQIFKLYRDSLILEASFLLLKCLNFKLTMLPKLLIRQENIRF